MSKRDDSHEPSTGFGLDANEQLKRDATPDNDWYKTREYGETLDLRYQTIPEALCAAAAQSPYGVTLLNEDPDLPDEVRSYRDIYSAACVVAARLAQQGISRGDHVLIVLPTSFDFLLSFYATQLLGAVPIPSYPPAAMERVELALSRTAAIANRAKVKLLITNEQLLPLHAGHARLATIVQRRVTFSELAREDLWTAKVSAPTTPITPDDAGFVQFTSGSTGDPKGVVLSHRNLVSNVHAMGLVSQMTPQDVTISWLPLYHDLGLIGAVLMPLYWQSGVVLMSPMAFLMRPSRWLQAFSKYRGTISSAPNFAYALCVRRVRPNERKGLDLSTWRIAGNGAEPISLRTLVDFQRTFGPHGFAEQAMQPMYGLAESTVGVTHSPFEHVFKWKQIDRAALGRGEVLSGEGPGSTTVVCVGKALPGHEVRIADKNGSPLPERRVGEVWVRGPSVMTGYLYDADATAKVMRDGWLLTGDLGFLSGNGLYITGREKDLIIVRGKNFAPEDIERVIERLGKVRGGGCIIFAQHDPDTASDHIVAVCETRIPMGASASAEADREALKLLINEATQEAFGLKLLDIALVPPGTLPKTSSGKKQRSFCAKLYRAGELRPSRTRAFTAAKLMIAGHLRQFWSNWRRPSES